MPGRVAVHGVNLDGDDQAGRPGAYLRIIEPGTAGLDGLLAAFATMIDRQAAFLPPTPA